MRRLGRTLGICGWLCMATMMAYSADESPRRSLWRVWAVEDGLTSPTVDWITQTPNGLLWLATPTGLMSFDGQRFRSHEVFASMDPASRRIRMIAADPSDGLWILNQAGEIASFSDGEPMPFNGDMGEPRAPFHGVYLDGVGTVGLSDAKGRVWMADCGHLQTWVDDLPTASDAFVGINVDRSGTVWSRYGKDLFWRENKEWRLIRHPDGSAFEALKTTPSQDGGMWIATNLGLRKFHAGKWESLWIEFPRPIQSIQSMLEDRQGNFWITQGKGPLWKLSRDGRAEILQTAGGDSDGGVLNLFEDRDSNLWVGTRLGGLQMLPSPTIRLALENPLSNPSGAPIVLESLHVDGQRTYMAGRDGNVRVFDLPAVFNSLEFQFTAVSLIEPGKILFRYRLEPGQKDWSDGVPARSFSLGQLASGSHLLRISAYRPDSPGRTSELGLRLRVAPRFWQTWRFRSMAAGFALLGILSLVNWRMRHLEKQRQRHQAFARRLLELQESERQRISHELHDGLGHQLLLIKNGAQMALLSPGVSKETTEQLGSLSAIASQALDEVRHIARNLRPFQLDQMGVTKAIRSLASSVEQTTPLRIKVDADELDGALPPAQEINVFRIVQEGLNNVVRHSAASEASLRIERNGREVTLDLTDNGRGFDEAASSAENHSGVGLGSIRERVRLLEGTVQFHSQPGQGTSLQIRFPIPANHSEYATT